ncbi:MAG TPA: NAD(P)H-quinone oxidoreductase [Candidatus Lambdaproteobacteria bacterium]|nr:NAD(P)H-quinone oxidoreductase [Candidatus Lambdaproteobacteria bacterium]HIO11527.1 NAD(P)H-quinone oxidoreductase [Deltaproteobacteria bacterium]HIB46149.1 NAD(P)H-quinone oxidoreductase [Candidatus Lambdaproteobacteria bacterium]HIB92847.1 NAD(P)H-quinone oxidoreductase [Candidatus Lambdaproteobacteria bacterium]HIO62478.1 NAD(P)H-quinone oxidoreductase [Deltaproteobacteria bacterium]
MNLTPKSMNYIKIEKHGDPEVLKLHSMPVPEPSPGEVLIRVSAAGVNRPDVMQRKGLYPPPPGATDVPGLEVSGTVVSTGKNVSEPMVGSEVCALVTCGGYAEYCLAAASICLPVPENISLEDAAGIPETFFTVWTNVFDRGQLKSGESFLVHGGSSGIGTAAIQLAKAFGATVYTTAGTPEKCEFCENLGADAAINYREQDFSEEIKRLTEGKGIDVILDMIGGPYFPKNICLLADEGRLVQIALMQGSKAEVDFRSLLLKRVTLTGSTLRPRSVEQKTEIAKALRKNVWPLLDTGTVRPIIHQTFPLTQAAEAHSLMESSAHIGKILLKT